MISTYRSLNIRNPNEYWYVKVWPSQYDNWKLSAWAKSSSQMPNHCKNRRKISMQFTTASCITVTEDKKSWGGTSRSWNGHLFDTVDIDLMDVASDLVYFMFCNTSSIYSTEKHFFFCKHESNLHLYIWYNHKLYPFGFITLQFRTPVRESLPFLCLCMHIHIIVLKQ